MPRKKKVDAKKLIQAVESGRPSVTIMDEFDIKTHSQLKSLYVDALAEEGRVPPIISARRGGAEVTDNSKELRVNKRGSLVVPKDLIDEMGFQTGDAFTVRKTPAGVSLRRM